MLNKTDLDPLIDQFDQNPNNPRVQKDAIRKMAQLKDPKAITELNGIYLKGDIEPSVHKAATDALRTYRRLEQQITSGKPASPLSPELLERVRSALLILLVVTVIGNAAVFIVHALPAPAAPVQTVATDRAVLTTALKTRLDNIRADGSTLRGRWQELQAHLNLTCTDKFTNADKVDAAPIDLTTYSDLRALNDDLNNSAQQIAALRTKWLAICKNPNDAAIVAQNAGSDGAAGRIKDVDGALAILAKAQTEYDKWVSNPAPTSAPTATLTVAPVTPTLTPTIGPSVTPSLIPTVPTITPTPIQTLTLSSAQLSALTSYAYTLDIEYGGQKNGDVSRTFNGSLVIKVNRTTQLNVANAGAQYDISVNDDAKLLSVYNPSLFIKGVTRYTYANGVFYYQGIFPISNPTCKKLGAAIGSQLDSIQPDVFFKLLATPLQRVQPDQLINGLVAQHYHADDKNGATDAQITAQTDVFVTGDKQVPLQVTYTVTGPYAGLKGVPATTSLTKFSLNYTLTQYNPPIAIKPSADCAQLK